MIEDPIPSGLSPSRVMTSTNWTSVPIGEPLVHNRELRDDRTTFFNMYFPQGSKIMCTAKVVNPGVFRVSPTSVEPMYQPSIFRPPMH